MKIEISTEAVDEIFRSILIQDYINLKSDIRRLKESPDLKDYQKEDLNDNKKYLKAMKKMMQYYIGFDWKQKLKEYE
jgi:hypothetical protein